MDPDIIYSGNKAFLDGSHERYVNHYGWLHIAYDPEVAQAVDRESEEFRRGLKWYAAYRWLFGHKNSYLDGLIDCGELVPEKLTRQDYQANCREYLVKGVRWFGW